MSSVNVCRGYMLVLVPLRFEFEVGVNNPIETTIGSPSPTPTVPRIRIPLSAPTTMGPGLCIVPAPVPIPLLISTLGPTAPFCKLDIDACECGTGDVDEREGYAGYAGVIGDKSACCWAL